MLHPRVRVKGPVALPQPEWVSLMTTQLFRPETDLAFRFMLLPVDAAEFSGDADANGSVEPDAEECSQVRVLADAGFASGPDPETADAAASAG